MASCMTILWLNVPYFIAVTVLVFAMWLLPVHISFHEIIFAWIPIITSACNPIIILTRTSATRAAVFALFNRRNSKFKASNLPINIIDTGRWHVLSRIYFHVKSRLILQLLLLSRSYVRSTADIFPHISLSRIRARSSSFLFIPTSLSNVDR